MNCSPIVVHQGKEKSQNHSQVRQINQHTHSSNTNIKPANETIITMKTQELPKSAMGHQGKKQTSRVSNSKTSKTMNNLPPSCLQIDLSSLSNKNEDEIIQIYGGP